MIDLFVGEDQPSTSTVSLMLQAMKLKLPAMQAGVVRVSLIQFMSIL